MARKMSRVRYPDGSSRHIGRKERDDLLLAGLLKQTGPRDYRSLLPIADVQSSNVWFGTQVVTRYDSKLDSWFSSRIRQSRDDNAPGIHTQEQWIERVKYFGWRCRYCKANLTVKTLTKDHQIPLSRNGSNWAANLVPACKSCNSGKCDRKPSEWRVLAT